MRAWEPEPGELRSGGKAWEAFKVYRDLGPGRSLRAVANIIYGEGIKHGKRTVEGWSSRFDWVERVRAFDDWREMIRLGAIEEYERTAGAEYARKQEKLREKTLEIGERAADHALQMLNFPLVEQKTVRPNPETGEMTTIIFTPARWTKNTIARLYAVAAKAAGEPERIEISGAKERDGYADNPAAQAAIDAFLDAIDSGEGAPNGPGEAR